MYELALMLSNAQILMIGQAVIALMVLAAIILQIRNMRIGKLLVRDKTIMFAGFIKREDYDAVIKKEGHLFRMIPEEDIKDILNKKNEVIEPNVIENPDNEVKKDRDLNI